MNVQDILNLDISEISKMDRKTLAKTVSTLASAGNKRVKRLKNKGIETPALRGLEKTGGNLSVKGKDVNALRKEFMRAKTFLTAKTSTFKGYKAVQKEFEERIGGKLTPEQTKRFWSAYNKANEREPNFLKLYGSSQMQSYIREEIEQNKGLDSTQLAEKAINRINELYEEEQAQGEEFDFGTFFEYGGND